MENKMEYFLNLPEKEKRGAIAVDYLAEKYDREFAYQEVREPDLNDDFYRVIAYPFDNPNALFETRIQYDNKNNTDELLVKEACLNYAEKMLNQIKVINGDIYIWIRSLCRFPDTDARQLSIHDLQQLSPMNKYQINIFYSEDENESDDINGIINQMLNEDPDVSGILFLYRIPSKIFADVQNYLESHDQIYMDFNDIIGSIVPTKFDVRYGKIEKK